MGRPKGSKNVVSRSGKKRTANDCAANYVTAQRLEEENEILEMEAGNDPNESPVNNVQESSEHSAQQPEVQLEAPENTIEIPSFEQKAWTAKWRLQFFANFRKAKTGKIFATCKLCQPLQYFAADTSSFSNLKNHVVRVHNKEWTQFVGVKQDAVQSSISSYTTSKKINPNMKQQLDDGLALMIAGANLPVSLVRNKYFVNWVKVSSS